MDDVTRTNLANFSRATELRTKIAQLQAKQDALATLAQSMSSLGSDLSRDLQLAKSQLATVETGGGAGLTDDFGQFSVTDRVLREERWAGKEAWVDFIKANPECSEAEAVPVYVNAALAARPKDRQWLLQDPMGLRKEYTAELLRRGMIADDGWESYRAFILATSRKDLTSQEEAV